MIKWSFNPQEYGNLLEASGAEMSRREHNFLLFLLREYAPKKILEVGVSAGGTSALLLKNMSPDATLFGIDASSQWYRDNTKRTGFKVSELCTPEEMARYTLIAGADVVDAIDQVGDGIDFCILYTTHSLPGELLQFFVVYPFMKSGAVLVLHDLSLNFWIEQGKPADLRSSFYATRIVFSVLASRRKYMPNMAAPNIGAIIMDDDTKRSIDSAFFALGITWHYFPANILERYRNFFKIHYDEFCNKFFDQCLICQQCLTNFTR